MESLLEAIGIRWQLLVTQIAGFLIVYAILKKFLFGRVTQVLEDRVAEEDRRRQAIVASKGLYEAAKGRLDAREAEIERQAYEQTQAEVRAGLKRKADLTAAALDRAREEVTAARAELDTTHDQALARIREDVVALTLYVADTLTDRKIARSAEQVALAEREVGALLEAQESPLRRARPSEVGP